MIDWNLIKDNSSKILSRYLKINSLNPPGNEVETAHFLASLLKERAMEPQLFQSGADRVNLIARLPGDGRKEPVLLYNHMDVVEADPERWTCDPFGGEIRDGYVWGRGAIDMKSMGIMQLVAMDLLRQHHPIRSRDIIFFAAADEETGGKLGTQWMIKNHWDKIKAEYVWDEGGFGLQGLFGPTPVFSVAIAEKKTLWLKLIAHGQPGQSGMPHPNNAANILLNALNRIMAVETDYEIIPVTKMMFNKIGSSLPFPQSFLLKNIHIPLIFKLVKPTLTSNPTTAAMLKNTICLTTLKAGEKENVIPDIAEATLDVRLLPDKDPQEFLTMLRKLMADERVEIEIILSPERGTISDVNTDFYQALTKVILTRVPGSVISPILTPGTTDSCFFRQQGINCYGLFPSIIDPGELARFHGIDERISLDNLLLGIQIIYNVLEEMTK